MKPRFLLAALLLSATATPAFSHTPYLAPANFDPVSGGLVTLDAAFAE